MENLRRPTKNRSGVTFSAVVISGHTDRIGALPYNMKISERLAAAAKDYLENAEHIDPAMIFWEGRGPMRPLPITEFCDKQTTSKALIECLAPNRRITIEVIGTARQRPNFAAVAFPALQSTD